MLAVAMGAAWLVAAAAMATAMAVAEEAKKNLVVDGQGPPKESAAVHALLVLAAVHAFLAVALTLANEVAVRATFLSSCCSAAIQHFL